MFNNRSLRGPNLGKKKRRPRERVKTRTKQDIPITECKRMDEILSAGDPSCFKHQEMVDDECSNGV
jgi:ribosomal protein L16 Arg81 hydroxylase